MSIHMLCSNPSEKMVRGNQSKRAFRCSILSWERVFMAHGYAGKIEGSAKLGTKVSVIRIYNSGIWTLQ